MYLYFLSDHFNKRRIRKGFSYYNQTDVYSKTSADLSFDDEMMA